MAERVTTTYTVVLTTPADSEAMPPSPSEVEAAIEAASKKKGLPDVSIAVTVA